jgi:hypothetical protein
MLFSPDNLCIFLNVNLKYEYMSFRHFAWKIAYIISLSTLIFACIIVHLILHLYLIEVIKLKFCVTKDKAVNKSYISFLL